MSDTSTALTADDESHIKRLYESFVKLRAADPTSSGRVEAWTNTLMSQVRELDEQILALVARLKAQSRQMRRLEQENDWLRGRVTAADLDGRDGDRP